MPATTRRKKRDDLGGMLLRKMQRRGIRVEALRDAIVQAGYGTKSGTLSTPYMYAYISHGRAPLTNTEAFLDTFWSCLEDLGFPVVEARQFRSQYVKAQRNGSNAHDQGEELMQYREFVAMEPALQNRLRLSCDPFDPHGCTDEPFESNAYKRARGTLRRRIREGVLTVLEGEVGSGKTTLLLSLLQEFDPETARGTVLVQPALRDMRSLISSHVTTAIADALLMEIHGRNAEVRDRMVSRALEAQAEQGRRFVIVLDDAHQVPLHTLRQAKRWTDLRQAGKPLVSFLLIGQDPELGNRLQEPQLREVYSRASYVRMGRMAADAAEYLEHRMRYAGGSLSQLFTPHGLQALLECMKRADKLMQLTPLFVNALASRVVNDAWEAGQDLPVKKERVYASLAVFAPRR